MRLLSLWALRDPFSSGPDLCHMTASWCLPLFSFWVQIALFWVFLGFLLLSLFWYNICLSLPLPQDKMGPFWCCLKSRGRLRAEPTPSLGSNIISVHPKQCVCRVSAFCRGTITHQTTCITELQKNCCENQYCGNIINCGGSRGGGSAHRLGLIETRGASAAPHLSLLFPPLPLPRSLGLWHLRLIFFIPFLFSFKMYVKANCCFS